MGLMGEIIATNGSSSELVVGMGDIGCARLLITNIEIEACK